MTSSESRPAPSPVEGIPGSGSRLLAGRTAVVTGGGTGIGRAAVSAFAAAGAKVLVADVNAVAGEEAVRAVRDGGGEARFVRTDVSKAADVEAMVRAAVEAWGRLDCAFNNAADSAAHTAALVPVHEYPEAAWDRILAVNLKGTFLCLKYEVGQMLKQGGGGAIVNMASAVGLVGDPNKAGYVASKHGIVGLTKTVALETAAKGIRVNAICPGWVRTPLTAERLADPATRAVLLAKEPVGRAAEPEEVAGAVVWMCSDAASFMTGAAVPLDGGWTAQ